jgi:hypothetical protein
VAGAQKQAEAPAAATAMAGAAGGASGASSGLGAVDKVPSAVDDPRAAVQRTGGSADKSAAAAKGSMHGALGEQTAPEVNEVAAGGPGQDAPGEPLASDAGITAAAAAAKDPCSVLGMEAPRQCVDMAAQDEGPADGALVGSGEALGAELEPRAPAWGEKAVTAKRGRTPWWWQRGEEARQQATAQAVATGTAVGAADAMGSSFGLGAPGKEPPAVNDPRTAF